MLPGHTPDEDGHVAAFRRGERPLHRTPELLLNLHQARAGAQTRALRPDPLRNFISLRIRIRLDHFLFDCFWHGLFLCC
jgi:hypothetical protein